LLIFQNETPNLFYIANMTIDIAIVSYLVGVCISYVCQNEMRNRLD